MQLVYSTASAAWAVSVILGAQVRELYTLYVNKFPDFFVQAFEIVVDSWNSVCYCYTYYEMTDQFLLFQVQINSYSSNWNTP